MIFGLYLSTMGAKGQERRIDVLANNVANVSTNGFRRQMAQLVERPNHPDEMGGQPLPSHLQAMGGGVMLGSVPTSWQEGSYRFTGNQTDLAIRGDGFFEIRKGDKTYLTRAGNFTMDATGAITTDDGSLLLGEGGSIRIDPQGEKTIRIDPSGEVIQGTTTVGRIRLVKPSNPDAMVRVGGNLFLAPDTIPADEARVEQSYLEGSNADPIMSMTELLEASRIFEGNLQMISIQNDGLSRLIQQSGAN